MNIFNIILIEPLANGLMLFYNLLFNNMALAIIGFSLLVRALLYPLTKPYMDSMKKMKELAPQLEKLKKKHKNDKVKMAKAQSDFYREKNVKPTAGCIPYILQIVVLIALFNVFIRTLSPDVDTVTKFNELLYPPLQIEEGTSLNTSFLYTDVTKPDRFDFDGIPFPVPGPLLFLTVIIQIASSKIMAPYTKKQEAIAEKTKGSSDDIQAAMQKSMIYTFPFITLVIGVRFPSGLALYWLVFSLSQAYIQYRAQGWGGLTPWMERFGLLKTQ